MLVPSARRLWRRATVALACSSAVALLPVPAAEAAFPPFDLVEANMMAPEVTRVAADCNLDGTSTISYETDGHTTWGTYPGTWHETGTITLGPHSGAYPLQVYSWHPVATVTSYEADFTIRQADGTVLRGHKTLGDAYQKEMFCNIVSDEPVPGRSGLPVNGELHFGELRGIDYAVTVTAPDGASASTGGDAVFVFNYERYDDFQGSPYLGAQLFTLMYRGEFPAPPDDDTDDDGVEDALGTGAGAWQDASIEPPTIGRIVDRNGLDVRVEDAPDAADGVRITVGGDPGLRATFSVCGFTVRLAGGTDAVFTCGSISLKVATGRAEIVLAEGAIVTVPGGVAAKVTDADADGGHTVVNQGGGTVTISLGDATAQLAAGQSRAIRTWRFDGFRAPVDNGRVLNSLKAGQAVPLRWRLTRADGTPVTTLTSVKLTVEGLACGAGATADAVEELATGGSGLRNLGNGEYQYNWATPKSYANSCKRLRLDVGDGVTHDALFQFRP